MNSLAASFVFSRDTTRPSYYNQSFPPLEMTGPSRPSEISSLSSLRQVESTPAIFASLSNQEISAASSSSSFWSHRGISPPSLLHEAPDFSSFYQVNEDFGSFNNPMGRPGVTASHGSDLLKEALQNKFKAQGWIYPKEEKSNELPSTQLSQWEAFSDILSEALNSYQQELLTGVKSWSDLTTPTSNLFHSIWDYASQWTTFAFSDTAKEKAALIEALLTSSLNWHTGEDEEEKTLFVSRKKPSSFLAESSLDRLIKEVFSKNQEMPLTQEEDQLFRERANELKEELLKGVSFREASAEEMARKEKIQSLVKPAFLEENQPVPKVIFPNQQKRDFLKSVLLLGEEKNNQLDSSTLGVEQREQIQREGNIEAQEIEKLLQQAERELFERRIQSLVEGRFKSGNFVRDRNRLISYREEFDSKKELQHLKMPASDAQFGTVVNQEAFARGEFEIEFLPPQMQWDFIKQQREMAVRRKNLPFMEHDLIQEYRDQYQRTKEASSWFQEHKIEFQEDSPKIVFPQEWFSLEKELQHLIEDTSDLLFSFTKSIYSKAFLPTSLRVDLKKILHYLGKEDGANKKEEEFYFDFHGLGEKSYSTLSSLIIFAALYFCRQWSLSTESKKLKSMPLSDDLPLLPQQPLIVGMVTGGAIPTSGLEGNGRLGINEGVPSTDSEEDDFSEKSDTSFSAVTRYNSSVWRTVSSPITTSPSESVDRTTPESKGESYRTEQTEASGGVSLNGSNSVTEGKEDSIPRSSPFFLRGQMEEGVSNYNTFVPLKFSSSPRSSRVTRLVPLMNPSSQEFLRRTKRASSESSGVLDISLKKTLRSPKSPEDFYQSPFHPSSGEVSSPVSQGSEDSKLPYDYDTMLEFGGESDLEAYPFSSNPLSCGDSKSLRRLSAYIGYEDGLEKIGDRLLAPAIDGGNPSFVLRARREMLQPSTAEFTEGDGEVGHPKTIPFTGDSGSREESPHFMYKNMLGITEGSFKGFSEELIQTMPFTENPLRSLSLEARFRKELEELEELAERGLVTERRKVFQNMPLRPGVHRPGYTPQSAPEPGKERSGPRAFGGQGIPDIFLQEGNRERIEDLTREMAILHRNHFISGTLNGLIVLITLIGLYEMLHLLSSQLLIEKNVNQ